MKRPTILRMAKDLDLPLDAVTQKIAWLGRTGSGKTFASKRMVEQMLRARAQVVILDGAGVWPGLRLGPKSFDVPVLGGLYGDIPLEPTAGALVADVIVDSGTSIVLDVSQMIDADRTRFATAFAGRFFQRKKAAPGAVHLVLEECQDYVPENQARGEERMLHEFVRIAKQGRSFGIGVSFISQRPQEISKKALNQAECVFAFQMTGPQERKALEYWLSDKGFEGKLASILPTLAIGSPHVWSPQWLKISRVVKILPIDSLDTSKTPKVGEKAFAQKKLAPIDLKGLSAAMAETLERAKADDPTLLKKRIVELEKLAALANRKLPSSMIREAATAPVKGIVLGEFEIVVDRRHLEDTIKLSEEFEQTVLAFEKSLGPVRVAANVTAASARRARETGPAALAKRLKKAPPPQRGAVSEKFLREGKRDLNYLRPAKSPSARVDGAGTRDPAIGDSGLFRMMVALAQRPEGLSRRSLGLRAGLSSRTGTFGTYLSRARTAGWIEGKSDLKITDEGVKALGSYEPLPTGRALFDYWLKEIGTDSGAGRMLSALSEAYPNSLSRVELAERSNLSAATGTFGTYLSRLRGLELIDGKSDLVLSEELIEE